MNEALQNPQLIDMMIQQNPMLRDMGPRVREMLQSPMFRRMLTDPNMIRQMTQMQRSMGAGPFGGGGGGDGGAGGGNAAFPAPGVTNTTADENREQQPDSTAQANQGGQANQNPFGMFGMPGQGQGQGGAGAGAANPFAALFGGMPPAAGGNAGNNATGNAMTTQAPSDTTAQGSEATSQGTTGGTDGTAGAQGSNAQNPFAALFNNPALLANAGGADPNANPQQTQNAQQNPYANPMNNPFLQNPELFNQMLQAMGGGENAGAANNNPMGMLGMGGGMGGAGAGGGGGQPQQDNRPPEERYEEQLRQLNDMGFFDFDQNVEALRRTGGSVQGAVEYLLGGS